MIFLFSDTRFYYLSSYLYERGILKAKAKLYLQFFFLPLCSQELQFFLAGLNLGDEDEAITFLQNVENQLPNDTA
jgi:hypothetical protein